MVDITGEPCRDRTCGPLLKRQELPEEGQSQNAAKQLINNNLQQAETTSNFSISSNIVILNHKKGEKRATSR